MDQVEHVKKLREEYERALDAAESRRSAYHEAVLDLYRGGTPLREIAKELGLSHQRVHQIVSGEPPGRGKLPRAAGGAVGAALVLVLVAATFGALRLAHAPPFAQRSAAPPHISVGFSSRHLGFRPGGAVLRRKREILVRRTRLGRVSLWRAPDSVSRSARCVWLQIGKVGEGGSCYQLASGRALPEVVAPELRIGGLRASQLPLIWGRVSPRVARLTVLFKDGTRSTFAGRDGLFLYAVPVPQSRWARGHVPAFLVARDAEGRVLDKRPFPPNAPPSVPGY